MTHAKAGSPNHPTERRNAGVAAPETRPYPGRMTQTSPAARIDAALARIEAAVEAHGHAAADLGRRHAELKRQVADAIAALDDLLATPVGAAD